MSTTRFRLRLILVSTVFIAVSCTGSSAAPAEEPDLANPDLENMDSLLTNMGAADVAATRACIIDAAAEEGLTVEDLMGGTGAPVFVGALRCDDAIAERMVGSAAAFDTTGTDLTIEDVECVQRMSLELFAMMPLASTEDLFSEDEPPNDFIDGLMGRCDVDRDEALLIMG